jgi:carotenoid cleavage dioxygenase
MRFEVDLHDCDVSGRIPAELDGSFYRLHLDWLYPPKFADDTPLAADGYMSMFRLKAGRAHYKGRYVRTERYRNQVDAGGQLYGYYRNPYTDDASVRDTEHPNRRTTANTTPVLLGGRLYATKEDGLPYEMDPDTLDTRSQTDFGGAWRSQTFTAHPKLDPVTGETIGYGYEATSLCSRDVFVCCLDRAGRITRQWQFEAPHTSVLHDMWLTAEHIVIPGGGLVTDLERLKAGGLHWHWDRSKPSWFAVIPRRGTSRDIRFFFGPERSIVHTANARTEGHRIVLDAPVANGNTWPFFPDITGAPYRPVPNTFRRITLDLASSTNAVHEETLFETPMSSFVRIDERFLTRAYRYFYVQYADAKLDSGGILGRTDGNCIGRFDVSAGRFDSFYPGPGRAIHEPVFVPHESSSAEGDGHLLAVAHNVPDASTELHVIDAVTMQGLAVVTLPFRSSPQVHGTWAAAGQLA